MYNVFMTMYYCKLSLKLSYYHFCRFVVCFIVPHFVILNFIEYTFRFRFRYWNPFRSVLKRFMCASIGRYWNIFRVPVSVAIGTFSCTCSIIGLYWCDFVYQYWQSERSLSRSIVIANHLNEQNACMRRFLLTRID